MGDSRINRDEILLAIIQFKTEFLDMLDYINQHNTGCEIPYAKYMNFYEKQVSTHPDKNYHQKLSFEAMLDNGLFVYWNKQSYMVAFATVIVDLLRFMDNTRMKELSNAEFNKYRIGIKALSERLPHLDYGSEDYVEELLAYKNQMNEIASHVRENTLVLKERVYEIADMYQRRNNEGSKVNIEELYTQVDKLFRRHVQPFLEFVSPAKIVVDGSFSSFVDTINNIIRLKGGGEAAATGFYQKTAITFYYKEIGELTGQLRGILNMIHEERSSYIATESIHKQLMNALAPLRHGGQRNIFLKPDAAVFGHFSALLGLNNHNAAYKAKFAGRQDNTPARFEKYIEIIKDTVLQKNHVPELVSVPENMYPEYDRQQLISSCLLSQQIPSTIPDLYLYIHEILMENLQDYNLSDSLYGFEVLLNEIDPEQIIYTTRKRISDELYFLDYMGWQYGKEKLNGE
jgi:hypothetical protein